MSMSEVPLPLSPLPKRTMDRSVVYIYLHFTEGGVLVKNVKTLYFLRALANALEAGSY